MAQTLSNLHIGDRIKFGKHQVNTETAQSIIWVIADINHTGYPANSVTLLAQKIIDLRAYDATETGSANGNTNYAKSNINQWLNSSASAGNWYSATHTNDAPPIAGNIQGNTAYQARAGFLYNFTASERNAILPTTFNLQVGADFSTKMVANVFLPSLWEILGGGSVVDGSSCFEYCLSKGGSTTLTQQAYDNTPSGNRPSSINNTWQFFTRNSSNGLCYLIQANNELTGTPNNGIYGIRPVTNLSASTKISDTVDSDGCYNFIANNAPVISGSNSDLGNKSDDFTVNYTVTDSNSDPVTVREYIDNVEIRSYVATLGSTNTFAVNGVTWLKLTNGSHTLKIVATDGFDTVTRVYTFTKSSSKLIVKLKNPIESSTRPSRIIVTLVKNIPKTAKCIVEVCNNGFDASPTWETIDASSISSGIPYEFTNESKDSGKSWGVSIRVTVDRNGASGACYITEIGGNFE